MPRPTLILGTLSLDASAETPLYKQLYDGLRASILDGRIAPGSQLPSTRALASELQIGRNTIIAAYEQLTAEGYLAPHVGSGTRVADIPPDTLLEVDASSKRKRQAPAPSSPLLSKRGQVLAGIERNAARYHGLKALAFQHGLPAVEEFPRAIWSRLIGERAKSLRASFYDYELSAGLPELQAAIAAYVGAARGVIAAPEQVIVITGAQSALDLAARMLIDPGDRVWHEEPGYLGARGAFLGSGADIVPIPVDENGMKVEDAVATAPVPRLIYVTPSHQYPLGHTLTLPRRLALIEYARRENAWIIEDDYDSEYRYTGRPIAAMQGLDRGGSVIYMGTFAKTLFPALRIGYLIVPQTLAKSFGTALRLTGQTPATLHQAALADFITQGHFGAHVRRMRALYAERRACLIDSIERYMSDWLQPVSGEGGLQLATKLVPELNDRLVSQRGREAQVVTTPLSNYCLEKPVHSGLHMGFAAVPPGDIERAAKRLGAVISRNDASLSARNAAR
ncbi:MAG: PLP-dependent aminotransferase family protein [Parvibaculaceae bacterium]|nr:PLP-dependent aminotransferase family protein [Parvibaculaceae bacterium]